MRLSPRIGRNQAKMPRAIRAGEFNKRVQSLLTDNPNLEVVTGAQSTSGTKLSIIADPIVDVTIEEGRLVLWRVLR